MEKRVFFYAFDGLNRIVDCRFIIRDNLRVADLKHTSTHMRMYCYPNKVTIVAIEQRPGLFSEFNEAKNSTDHSVRTIFKNTVVSEGIVLD